ncbi:MAG: glycoside hydrolase family 31 protein [Clostridia bacterium]|nr:glycoside hydrolase family 31 protein [Clostridia bacterium]
MKKFGKLLSFEKKGNTVNINFEGGVGKLEILTGRIVNVFSPLASEDHRSKAIEGNKAKKTDFSCEMAANCLVVKTAYLTAKVYSGFKVDFYNNEGKTLCRDYRGKMTKVERFSPSHPFYDDGSKPAWDKPVSVIKSLSKGECLMGLGDKAGFIDKSGYEYRMWNRDTTDVHDEQMPEIYKSIPFMLSKRPNGTVYGIFFDNTFRSYFNMGHDDPSYMWYGADDGNLDYYFISGDDLVDIVKGYCYLTGTTPLPQRWTLGYQQSRWGYMNDEDIRYIAENMRANDIPCDAIHFDIEYMEAYKDFTWDKTRFPDAKKTLADIKKMGFKTVTIIDPAIKIEKNYPVYEEGLKRGCFAKDSSGLPYVNACWPGDALFPDFGLPETRKWWGENIARHLTTGVDAIWNDMNEPASFKGELPDNVVMHDGRRETCHAEMHNVYGHYMDMATYEAIKKATGKRPFVITRACFAGTQKYATAWTGDNRSVWTHLRTAIPQLCSLGLCGMTFVGTDIGGFIQDTTPELLSRWVEAACFSPLFRNHCDKWGRRQEPWMFGKETLDIYRKFVKLRYAFIPYIYDLFFEGEKTGLGVMRPLALHFENDARALRCNTEFTVGEKLLVAPVVEPGVTERAVYLPKGDWYDVATGKKIRGGRSIIASAPLDTLPMFAAAGAIFPNYEEMKYVGEKKLDRLILKVFRGEGEYFHYEDNGEDFAYRRGEYNKYRFTLKGDGVFTCRLVHDGYKNKYKKFTVEFEGKVFNAKGPDFEIKLY